MRRRDMLAAAACLATLRGPRAQGTRVLRFIAGDAASGLDPVADPRPEVAAAALLVWDTLYGIDSQLQAQPQMCEGHEASEDARVWTFRLRPGLRFHDDTAVLAADAAASLRRWMARDRMGQAIAGRLEALEVLDERSFRLRLHAPFGPMLYALGKCTAPLAVVMPARLAASDPATPVAEAIGSGPMRLRFGSDARVFDRFDGYIPRAEGTDWLAGGKRMLFERIEWLHLPDAAAAEALQSGEADWWAAPSPEAVPLLKRNRNVLVDIADPLGWVGTLRLNHGRPPFDDPRARRAVRLGLSQEACMQAVTGGDDALWKPMPGAFTPGTPLARLVTDADPPAPRDLDAARRMLGEAAGARVVVLAASGATARALANAVGTQLQQIGFAPDVLPLSDAVLAQRLAEPDGWHAFATWGDGAAAATPAWEALDAGTAGLGWQHLPEVQDAVAAWYAATTPAAAAAAAAWVSRASTAGVGFVPTGFFLRYQAWRTALSGIDHAPLPLFWGVQKS